MQESVASYTFAVVVESNATPRRPAAAAEILACILIQPHWPVGLMKDIAERQQA